ncbi:MAG: crosslink repair DNA glycosylase YcaQ family protein, partial [Anaerolineae bacterium]|nr:crosslink repair DNA glycosylase YcaQ family protein [Anaerolineae bacterium]
QCALLARAVRALGVATPRWAGEYFHVRRKDVAALLADMAGRGVLVDAAVEGVDAPAYVHPDNLPLADAAARGDLRPRLTTLLSPFDPLVCDRGRVRTLFGFDFALECYTPAARRRYGYYALPVLRRGELIGRLDAKVHRREGRFQVKALYLEPGVAPSEQLVADLGQAVGECAAWHGASEVIIDRAEPPEVTDGLRQAVRQSDPGAPG